MDQEYTPGWYPVAQSAQLRRGQVRAIDVCGRQLVLFRTESGRVAVVDKYCAHQRTSLATGSVQGENLRCRFHGWQYDTRGRCVRVQGCSSQLDTLEIPGGTDIRAYPARETLGLVWLFFGDEVYYQLPSDEELFPGGKWRRVGAGDVGEINTDCRDIMENGVDCAHFEPVHNIRIRAARFGEVTPDKLRFQVDIRAALDEVILDGKAANLLARFGLDTYFDGTVNGTLYGPSLLFVHVDLDSRFYVPLRFATMLSPTGPRTTREYYAAYAPVGITNPFALLVARLFTAKLRSNLVGDKDMWHDKLPSDQAIFSQADLLPIARYRRWFGDLGKPAQAVTPAEPPAGMRHV